MKISQSETRAYSNCQMAHNFRFNQGLVPVKANANAAFLGTICHKGLEVFYKHIQEHGWNSYKDAAIEARNKINEMVAEDPLNAGYYARAMTILKNYFEYYQSDKERYRIISVEKEYEFVIGSNLKAGLRIDIIVEYLTGPLKGKIIMRDFKSTYDFWSDHKQEFNTQFPMYMYVLNKLFNYNMTYMELAQLRTRSLKNPLFDDLFQRTPLFFSEEEQASVFEEFVSTAHEIKYRRLNPELVSKPTRNPDYQWCESCAYARPCQLLRRGRVSDAESFIELEYTTKDPYSYGEKF